MHALHACREVRADVARASPISVVVLRNWLPLPHDDRSHCPRARVCSFVEDESIGEGVGYNSWSEIEVRARATEVVDSAVLYAAHAVLRRGYAYSAGQGTTWVHGRGGVVSRFVETPALKARVAHLVSGFRDVGSRTSMLLGQTVLHYFNNEPPAWWPIPTNLAYLTYANNTDFRTDAGLGFWADVCASFCVRRFDDDAEFMELDFTINTTVGNHGRCACYVYADTDTHSSHANKTSHAAPDDVRVRVALPTHHRHATDAWLTPLRHPPFPARCLSQALEFLYEFRKIPGDQPQDTHMFAMKKDVGNALFVPRLQSTLYWAPAFAPEYAPRMDAIGGRAFDSFTPSPRAASRDVCLEQCAAAAVEARAPLRMVAVNLGECLCFGYSELDLQYDDPTNDAGNANIDFQATPDDPAEVYVVRFCEFVRPDTTGRSLVFSKNAQPPAVSDTCVGSPAGLGYVISSGSTLSSYNQGTSSAPFDVLCREQCEARDDCAYSHVFAETFEYDAPSLNANTFFCIHATPTLVFAVRVQPSRPRAQEAATVRSHESNLHHTITLSLRARGTSACFACSHPGIFRRLASTAALCCDLRFSLAIFNSLERRSFSFNMDRHAFCLSAIVFRLFALVAACSSAGFSCFVLAILLPIRCRSSTERFDHVLVVMALLSSDER